MRRSRLLATALLGTAVMGATEAEAVFTMTVEQVGADVVETGSGTLNVSALTPAATGGADLSTEPVVGYLASGSGIGNVAQQDFYGGLFGPASFGPGNETQADVSSGDDAGIYGQLAWLLVPVGYVGGFLSNAQTYDNATFSSLGMIPGTYIWTWGSATGGTADSFVLEIGLPTPEPASLALLGFGLAGIGAMRRRRHV